MNQSTANDRRLYPQYPMIGVHALIIKDSYVLLVTRNKEPDKGMWIIPGGRVELGETYLEAVQRELLEECSIEIDIERILDVNDYILRDEEGRIKYHFMLIYLLARHKSGVVKAQSDAAEVRWVPLEKVRELFIHPHLLSLLEKAAPYL
jgi:ADP-ribose pyrophosphatase YjhB (NUDIX family)